MANTMLQDMAVIAKECITNPKRRSIWLPDSKKYVCPESEEGAKQAEIQAKEETKGTTGKTKNPPLNPVFKIVFVTAAGGTFFFMTLCIVMTLLTGKDVPPLFEKIIMGMFDLVKIGFGAIVGLLGGVKLQSNS